MLPASQQQSLGAKHAAGQTYCARCRPITSAKLKHRGSKNGTPPSEDRKFNSSGDTASSSSPKDQRRRQQPGDNLAQQDVKTIQLTSSSSSKQAKQVAYQPGRFQSSSMQLSDDEQQAVPGGDLSQAGASPLLFPSSSGASQRLALRTDPTLSHVDAVLSDAEVAAATSVPALFNLVQERAADGAQLPLGFCLAVLGRGAELGLNVGRVVTPQATSPRDGGVGLQLVELLAPSLQTLGGGKLTFGRAALLFQMHFDFAVLGDEACGSLATWLQEWLKGAGVEDVLEAAQKLAQLRLQQSPLGLRLAQRFAELLPSVTVQQCAAFLESSAATCPIPAVLCDHVACHLEDVLGGHLPPHSNSVSPPPPAPSATEPSQNGSTPTSAVVDDDILVSAATCVAFIGGTDAQAAPRAVAQLVETLVTLLPQASVSTCARGLHTLAKSLLLSNAQLRRAMHRMAPPDPTTWAPDVAATCLSTLAVGRGLWDSNVALQLQKEYAPQLLAAIGDGQGCQVADYARAIWAANAMGLNTHAGLHTITSSFHQSLGNATVHDCVLVMQAYRLRGPDAAGVVSDTVDQVLRTAHKAPVAVLQQAMRELRVMPLIGASDAYEQIRDELYMRQYGAQLDRSRIGRRAVALPHRGGQRRVKHRPGDAVTANQD